VDEAAGTSAVSIIFFNHSSPTGACFTLRDGRKRKRNGWSLNLRQIHPILAGFQTILHAIVNGCKTLGSRLPLRKYIGVLLVIHWPIEHSQQITLSPLACEKHTTCNHEKSTHTSNIDKFTTPRKFT
jgi:hypothetical protein